MKATERLLCCSQGAGRRKQPTMGCPNTPSRDHKSLPKVLRTRDLSPQALPQPSLPRRTVPAPHSSLFQAIPRALLSDKGQSYKLPNLPAHAAGPERRFGAEPRVKGSSSCGFSAGGLLGASQEKFFRPLLGRSESAPGRGAGLLSCSLPAFCQALLHV